MPKTAADVDEDFVHDSADDGSTSDSSSEEDDSEAVTRREGRPPSRVYDDPANVAWRLHGVAATCGQDAKRLGIEARREEAGTCVGTPLEVTPR